MRNAAKSLLKLSEFSVFAFVFLSGYSSNAEICTVDLTESTIESEYMEYILHVGEVVDRNSEVEHSTALCVETRYLSLGGDFEVIDEPRVVAYFENVPGGRCITRSLSESSGRDGYNGIDVLVEGHNVVVSSENRGLECTGATGLSSVVLHDFDEIEISVISSDIDFGVYNLYDESSVGVTRGLEYCELDDDDFDVGYGQGWVDMGLYYLNTGRFYVCENGSGIRCNFLNSSIDGSYDSVYIYGSLDDYPEIRVPDDYHHCTGSYYVYEWNAYWDGFMQISGGPGADSIGGSSNDDIIYGNSGSDVIAGGDGDDYLSGGSDYDYCFGGGDSDTCYCDYENSCDD